ncbi:MAG: hypothetical protein KAT34_12705 [Candidatus Aminicenantes bacterium]|nr:hypothetical protein [Candidatus Aminicenantes bacterium]
MKYSDLVELQGYFQPNYSMENESHDYWKQFIPNEQFYDILQITMTALTSPEPKDKKSIWIQGTYGTGKSHAAAVIKHLLWNEIDAIEDYLTSFDKVQLSERIKKYRRKNKIIPVVLVGIGSITDNRTFAFEIEKAVKKSLDRLGISLQTKSNFERMIDKIENSKYYNWDEIIKGNQELKNIVKNKEDIARKLKENDVDLLCTLDDIFKREHTHFSHEKIAEWLTEVADEIVNSGKASGLMIFWDEFTPLLEIQNSSAIVEQIQNTAELSRNKNIYLYLISHRDPSQANLSQDDIKKIKDRFHEKYYTMDPVTTYHIMSASIRKKNRESWEEQKEKVFKNNESLNGLIDRISDTHSAPVKNKLHDLYPIHPYSAYLSAFISRYLGSTNRSIFNFLYDQEKGFAKFITNEVKDDLFLTPDYLWDFFIAEFENQAKFSQVLEKYHHYEKKLQQEGDSFLCVFKGVLILNILFNLVQIGSGENILVNPSRDNIKSLFSGTGIEPGVDSVLNHIDSHEIIQKNPDDLFLVAFADLPHREVEAEKEKIRSQYDNVTKIIGVGESKEQFESIFDNVLRAKEIVFFPCSFDYDYLLKQKLNKAFRGNFTLHIAVFLLKDEGEKTKTIDLLKRLTKDKEFADIIFVIPDEPFTGKEYSRFIEYMAKSNVSHNHNYDEHAVTLVDNAKKTVLGWLGRIRGRYLSVFMKNSTRQELVSKIGDIVNDEIAPLLFRSGIDAIEGVRKNANIWKQQVTRTALDIFFSAPSRSHLEDKTTQTNYKPLRFILKDANGEYIVDCDLRLKEDSTSNLPLYQITRKVEEKFKKLEIETHFDLEAELEFLTKPPYGIYTNMPNMALLGFILKAYNGKLYELSTGKPLENTIMIDKLIELFEFWKNGKGREKLMVRFGSEEERELIRLLIDIFKFGEVEGLNDARWKVSNHIKNVGFPIWALKYYTSEKTIKEFADAVFKLVKSVDKEIKQKEIAEICTILEDNLFDIRLAIKDDNLRTGFNVFLKSVENAEISDEDISDVIEYLHKNLQEEVAFWEEDKVSSEVIKWRLQKIQKNRENTYPGSQGNDTGDYTGSTGYTKDELKISQEKAIEKIESFTGDLHSLKQKLIKIIEENAGISPTIEKYF